MKTQTNEKNDAYLWPPRPRLSFYRKRDKLRFSTTERDFDLCDGLMHTQNYRTEYFGLSTVSKRWIRWNSETLSRVEALIKYDFDFDGYYVRIHRISTPGQPCAVEFLWLLKIRPKL
jgi:hypothetical protein